MIRTPTYENYGIYRHQKIWDEMYGGKGVYSQADVSMGWHQLAENLTRIRAYIDSAIRGVQATQEGAGADAAVGTMAPMGGWVDEAQRLANDTRDRIDDQIRAFLRARDSVPDVPPEPRGGGWKEIPGIDSVTTSDQEIDEAFNAEQEWQARAAMMAYQNDSNERVVGVPQFAPPPAGEPDLSVPTARRSEIGGFPGSGSGGSGGGSAVPGAQTSLAGVGAGGAAELPAAPTGPQGGGFADPDRGGRPAPGGPTVPGVAPGGVVPVRPAAGGPRGPGSGRGGPGGGAAGMRGGPAAGGFRPLGGRGPGVGGFGPDRGGFGPTGSPESASARAAGTGAGGTGPAGAAGPGAAGAGRGVAGAGGVPFGGMGGGRGGEDNERRRPSYLIEPDSNELIGELPRTAPAVIGEDPPGHNESDRR